jgi:predicted RNA binding protein YcfA (HicA-like mRNA interferase family)
MPKPMTRRDVARRLNAIGAMVLREGGKHTVYVCCCGEKHKTAVPRHKVLTAGVVGSIQEQIACQEKGWLQ